MANLTASDWTVARITTGTQNPSIRGGKRHVRVRLTVGNGVKTYPTNGIPAPTYATLGLVRHLDTIQFTNYGVLRPVYDETNNTVRLYEPGNELIPDTDAPASLTLDGIAQGW